MNIKDILTFCKCKMLWNRTVVPITKRISNGSFEKKYSGLL